MIVAVTVAVFVTALVYLVRYELHAAERRRLRAEEDRDAHAALLMRGAAMMQREATQRQQDDVLRMEIEHRQTMGGHKRARPALAADRRHDDDPSPGLDWNSFNAPTAVHADTPVPHAHTSFSDLFTGGQSGGGGGGADWSGSHDSGSHDSGGSYGGDSGGDSGAGGGGGDGGGGDGGGGGE